LIWIIQAFVLDIEACNSAGSKIEKWEWDLACLVPLSTAFPCRESNAEREARWMETRGQLKKYEALQKATFSLDEMAPFQSMVRSLPTISH